MVKDCPSDGCKEFEDLKDLVHGKVSWKQLGVTVVAVVAILGFIWGGLDLTRSGEIRDVKAACDANSKGVQTFSINQAVVADRLRDLDHKLEKMEIRQEKAEQKRDQDIQVIHKRITDTKEAIINEIRKLDTK